ncbi:dihydroneopterin aldolase [Sinisalibacter aestuarii]|uniref:dihydroneopterin aldolase n=1 Tax=Sinisalibacter aestuarii TaxID=2949426 RepID=A0ABQ5LQN5_9RHOB|nr:dihydroneopterin aldolase [Sinisalibacter aestuarii]GKY87234.1 diguanylate cyclase [Sinisalibacter aestuarii]
MSSDTRIAFEHPIARAEASGQPSRPPDRISLRDHVVEADIGAFQSERGKRQRLNFNVVVEVIPPEGPVGDDVDKILSYDTITEAIAYELAEERLNLLETLAERIADRVLHAPQALRVFVRIEKLDRGPGALGVEIVRARGQTPPATEDAAEAPHPRVIYLSNAAIAGPGLGAFLDALEAGSQPVILCVGAGEAPAPQTGHRMTQRRIDLLAIEQNAWMLAARDDRCVVVATRTELDWAMKHGQISVWAPSKIVLDAVDGPAAGPRDAVALSAWFAEVMQATDLLVVGAEAPDAAPLPSRSLRVDELP